VGLVTSLIELGQSLFGFTSTHAIASWLPLFLFLVLFGLSMDYHVFILSRIQWLPQVSSSTPPPPPMAGQPPRQPVTVA
jgi:hypothetical protein